MITIVRRLQAESQCYILCNSKSSVNPNFDIQNIVVHSRGKNNDYRFIAG